MGTDCAALVPDWSRQRIVAPGSLDSQSPCVFDVSIEELLEVRYQVLWQTFLYDLADVVS